MGQDAVHHPPSPGGTTETLSEKAFQSSLRDWTGRGGRFPATEVLGYCQMSLRDTNAICLLQIGGLPPSLAERNDEISEQIIILHSSFVITLCLCASVVNWRVVSALLRPQPGEPLLHALAGF